MTVEQKDHCPAGGLHEYKVVEREANRQYSVCHCHKCNAHFIVSDKTLATLSSPRSEVF